jgi:hypothetical protein
MRIFYSILIGDERQMMEGACPSTATALTTVTVATMGFAGFVPLPLVLN